MALQRFIPADAADVGQGTRRLKNVGGETGNLHMMISHDKCRDTDGRRGRTAQFGRLVRMAVADSWASTSAGIHKATAAKTPAGRISV